LEYLRFFRRFERCALLRGKRCAIRKFDDEVRTRFALPPQRRKVGRVEADTLRRDAA